MQNIVESTLIYDNSRRKIVTKNTGDPTIIEINGVRYIAQIPGNKGGHSYIIRLCEEDEYSGDEDFYPTKVLKVSNVGVRKRSKKRLTFDERNKRFVREIVALRDCKAHHYLDIIDIQYVGYLEVLNGNSFLYFPFYMMDFADKDLRMYMDEMRDQIDDYAKIDLCLQLAQGLKELYNLGYYHRDLKPDNILFVRGKWQIGDLGLISFRNDDIDGDNEFIGPRGWESPEVMNKFLADGNDNFDSNIDHQSDIFQLGLIFWFIMQGNSPIGCIKRNDFTNSSDQIFEVIKRMIWHSKKDRYKEIDEVIDKLKHILSKI